jgi:hypothetical protein
VSLFETVPKPKLDDNWNCRAAWRPASAGRARETNMLATEIKTGRMESGKEIKVKIPVGYHIKLHTLKVLKGQSISDTVEIALQKYFQNHAWPEGMPGLPVKVETQ